MGHPEENPDVTETIEYDAPCDVLFANDLTEAAAETDVVTVGTGGGPRHDALLDLVDRLRQTGTEVHLVTVTPSAGGTEERVERTLERAGEWSDAENVVVHEAAANTVAEGLVDAASEHGGPLFIGASRTRMVRRRVFGSTPDRVIGRAEERDVPVVVYAHATGISSRLTDRLFPLYRYLRRKTSRSRRAQSSGVPTSTDPDDRAD